MDITWTSLLFVFFGIFYIWKHRNDEQDAAEKAENARKIMARDQVLYSHIKTGLFEYDCKENNDDGFFSRSMDAKHGDVLFETDTIIAYKVDHFADFRVGFYFKDIKQYGLYGSFDEFESYYRTDSTFKKEERLYYDDYDENDA